VKIRAAVLRGPHQPFSVEGLELLEELQPDEVLVKVTATGICHTDLAVRDQHIPAPLPALLGHEGSGVVARVGSAVTHVAPGDHVVLAPASCGSCEPCLQGHPSYCDDLLALNMPGARSDGSYPLTDQGRLPIGGFFFGQSSFASYSLARRSSVVKVPRDVPLETLGPLGCGLQTGAGTVLNVLRPGPGDSIAVFGVGPVGLAAIMAAKASHCTTIVAVDIHEGRLELARELGATHAINSAKESPSSTITGRVAKRGVSYAVDTTARSAVVNEALRSLRPMGRCAVVGVASTPKLELDNSALFGGRTLESIVEGDSVPAVFIPRLIALHQAGLFPFDRLLRFYDLDDIERAVADSESGATLKAVLRMP
jgi:aryl-alcohol dehydrogenase